MGWATPYIEKLKHGETVTFRPRGNSMAGKIESGQLCTVIPGTGRESEGRRHRLVQGKRFQYLHLIKAIQGKRFHIGNIRGRINGWNGENGIYGKCISIE